MKRSDDSGRCFNSQAMISRIWEWLRCRRYRLKATRNQPAPGVQASNVNCWDILDAEFTAICFVVCRRLFAGGMVHQDRDLDAPQTNVLTETTEEVSRERR